MAQEGDQRTARVSKDKNWACGWLAEWKGHIYYEAECAGAHFMSTLGMLWLEGCAGAETGTTGRKEEGRS